MNMHNHKCCNLVILLLKSIANTNTNTFVTILFTVFTFFRGHLLTKLIK